jgi:Tfp pilus assembly protein PilF
VVTRNPAWADDDTLRFHDLAVHPQSVKLLSNAGASLLDRGEPEQALAHFEAALRPEVTPERFLNPYQGKVTALVDLGRFDEARHLYDVVIRHGPRNPEIEQRIAAGLRAQRGRSLAP